MVAEVNCGNPEIYMKNRNWLQFVVAVQPRVLLRAATYRATEMRTVSNCCAANFVDKYSTQL